MDGDLFGVGPSTDNVNNNNTTTGGYSDEPSLLDFAAPPPSQEISNGFDLLQQQQQPEPPQSATENLLDFGATAPQPQNQQSSAASLADLFGATQLIPSTNPTLNTTPQPQSQAQHVDLFGSPIPSATPTPSLPEAAVASTPDVFAPIPAPAPPAAVDDPFAAFVQAQPKATAGSDPFSALSGNLSIPAPPQSVTAAAAEAKKTTNTPDSTPLTTQSNAVPNTMQTTTTATAPEESKTPEKGTKTAKMDEEEKKDQDSPMETVELGQQEETPPCVSENSKGAISVENIDDKKGGSPPEGNSTNAGAEIANTNPAAPETPKPDPIPVDPTTGGVFEDEPEPHELNLAENIPKGTPSRSSITAINQKSPAVPAERNVANGTAKNQQQPPSPSKTKFLSTMTKSPKVLEKKAPAAANRFAGFKSMAGSMAAKAAERVDKVKDQMQKEEGEGLSTSTNRFAGFKNMAGSMAAKAAERVDKVKDQMQKEDTDGQNANAKQRFAGFKNMAGNMAAKGAERVAKVKDQIQKEDANGQNVNVKRLAGFKNMAGNIAARGAKSVASVQVPQQLASVQVPKGFNAANLSLFGKGNKAIENSTTNSNHGKNIALAVQASPPSSSATAATPKPVQQTATATPTKPPSDPSTSPSTIMAVGTDPQPESQSKQPLAADAEAVPSGTAVESKQPESNGKAPQSSDAKNISSVSPEKFPTEKNSNANKVSEPVSQKASEADSAIMESSKSVEESTTLPPQKSSKAVNDRPKEAQNSIAPLADDSPVKSKPDGIEGAIFTSEKTEVKSVEPSDINQASHIRNPTSPQAEAESSSSKPTASEPIDETENTAASRPTGASNEPQTQQSPSGAQKFSPPSKEVSDQVEGLQKELIAAQALIMQLQKHKNVEENRQGDDVMVELQANLQKEMTRRAEAEEKARIAMAKSKQIEEEYTTFKGKSKSISDKLQANLQKEMAHRNEAEEKVRVAMAKSQQIEEEYSTFKEQSKSSVEEMTSNIASLTKEKDALEKEMVDIREERDEQARKEMALTTRLNAAKKKEAVKANAAEHFGDQVDQLELAVKEYESQVETLTAERDQLKVELGEWKEYAEKRTGQLEMALNDEKKLNDERKRKMKGFVEAKTEEVRAAKADYVSLQTELDQTSHSLTELNQRYKQLHAQWVQSQTRNRELQRDAMKMKKDSEKMHKVGGSLEARLSRSAQQSEDHKNKRIHARNELMSVLGQLEAERNVNSRLQESIKMTFTPKALSQQQTIQEALDDFDAALEKLSVRIGRPLPPTFSSNDPGAFTDNASTDGGSSLGPNDVDSGDVNEGSKPQGTVTLSEINSNKALQKLENETQRVSQNIVKFSASVERMHSLLDGGGTKSCVDVLSQILMSGNTPAIAASTPTRKAGGQRYGQISRNVP